MSTARMRARPRPQSKTPTAADLPPPGVKRWVSKRKAAVVRAVQSGDISLDEACKRYALTVDEFISWQRSYEKHGVPGLRVTALRQYRNS